MGSLFLLQQIFLIQELNGGLLHCRWILYQLSYQGSPSYMLTINQKPIADAQTHKRLSSLSVAWLCQTLWSHGLQHTRLPCLSPSPRICSNSHPLSRWCHPIISSSIVPFSSCLQSFPASGSFLMNSLFASVGQSIGASASVSVLTVNIQDWFPSGWTGLNSLLSKGYSRVFSNTTV